MHHRKYTSMVLCTHTHTNTIEPAGVAQGRTCGSDNDDPYELCEAGGDVLFGRDAAGGGGTGVGSGSSRHPDPRRSSGSETDIERRRERETEGGREGDWSELVNDRVKARARAKGKIPHEQITSALHYFVGFHKPGIRYR